MPARAEVAAHRKAASSALRLEKTLLFLWLAVNLVIGALIVDDYGMSIDEPNNYRYAYDTLEAYPSLFGTLYEPDLDSSYEGHGPAFVALAGFVIRSIQGAFPNVAAPDLWHYAYFITFLMTGLCLYWLAKRWFDRWTVWGILVLFGTQPLLLGHAFMNPKDIPFMFFFTLSVVLGFQFVDGMQARESFISLAGPVSELTRKYHAADPQRRRTFLRHLAAASILAISLLLFSGPIDQLIEGAVTYFYTAGPDTWAGQVFGSVASQASSTSAQDYVTKALQWFHRIEITLLVAILLYIATFLGLLLGNTDTRTLLQNFWRQRDQSSVQATRTSWKTGTLRSFFIDLVRTIGDPRLILAGVTLGLATAVRAIAPLAGLIVVLYLIRTVRSRAWPAAFAYFLIAGAVTYLAWPYLWSSPILNFLKELGVVSNFQHYAGRVLFDSRLWGIRDLPRSYLPVLLSIQLTEPAVLSAIIGMGLMLWRLLRSRLRTDMLLYVGLAFVLPVFGFILLNTPLYHNFRQVLFLVPAIFLLAAFTLEFIFKRMIHSWARLVLIAALALPGLYSSIRLHPYQYVYYNSLVGGTAGASNRYELDYWRTAMREVAIGLNSLAPQGARIVISGSASLFNRYARPDLVVETVAQNTYDLNGDYDYAIQLTRWQNYEIYPQAETVILVERNDAILATVKAVRDVPFK